MFCHQGCSLIRSSTVFTKKNPTFLWCIAKACYYYCYYYYFSATQSSWTTTGQDMVGKCDHHSPMTHLFHTFIKTQYCVKCDHPLPPRHILFHTFIKTQYCCVKCNDPLPLWHILFILLLRLIVFLQYGPVSLILWPVQVWSPQGSSCSPALHLSGENATQDCGCHSVTKQTCECGRDFPQCSPCCQCLGCC